MLVDKLNDNIMLKIPTQWIRVRHSIKSGGCLNISYNAHACIWLLIKYFVNSFQVVSCSKHSGRGLVGILAPYMSVQLESGCPFLGHSTDSRSVDEYSSRLKETTFFVTLEIVGNTVNKALAP